MNARQFLRSVKRSAHLALRIERPIVLLYHRVETIPHDPWQLAVAPDRFARQIALLQRHRNVVPMSWLASEIAAGRRPRRAAAITFDDGYSDFVRNAVPVLDAAGCPATMFVTTGPVEAGTGYWWDLLSRIILESPALPERIVIDIEGTRHEFDGAGQDRAHRDALLSQLHAQLRAIDAARRDEILRDLAEATGTDYASPARDRAMSPGDVASLAESGLIEIGAHTVTHPTMTMLPATEQEREVSESRQWCEDWTGRPIAGFAYPFGDVDDGARASVRASGLSYACTTFPHVVFRGASPFAIPRLFVGNWDEAEFRARVLSHG